jgi:hypothetical protein
LRQQLKSTRVSEADGPGYPTIVLSVDQAAAPAAQPQGLAPVEAEGFDEGVRFEVLLHIRDGYLAMLQIYRVDGGPLSRFPEVDSLQLIVPEG